MFPITIDIALFSIFLLVNLILGLRVGRHVKDLRDFSIGNKDFSTATVTSTIVATWIGGGFMFYAMKNIYTSGLQFILVTTGGTLSLLFTGQVLAVRMGEFLNNLSVAEAMGNLYGSVVRVITAISGILGAMGYIAVQFQVIAKMLTLLLGFQGPWVTIAAGSIVILYSAFGGIRSVIITDLFQFVVFSIFIPILALVVWNHLKNPSQVVTILTTNPIFSFTEVVGWNPKFLGAVSLMLYFAIPGMEPSIFQRVAMARNLEQVNKSFTYAAVVRLLIVLSVAWIAILLLADNPSLDPNNLVNYIITEYAYPGLKGLIAIGITAMAMSSADSDLNASAVLAVNDIINFINPSWKKSTIGIRVFSVCLGIGALVLAIYTTDLLDLLLISGSFYMPIVTVPLLMAIFGFRSSSRAVLIGMAAGFITVLCWDKLLGHTGINNIIPGVVANLLFLIGSHYILREPGGWVGIKDKAPLLAARQRRRDAWVSFINSIKETKIYDHLQKNLPAYEIVYSLFGLYVIGATYASFYTIPEGIIANYKKLYDFIAHSVLIATAGFLTYPAWPLTFKSKRFITFAWPAGIFYILFVVGTMLVMMSGFHEVQVMIFLLSLVMAAFLLSWPLMLFLSTVGILVGYLVFYMYSVNTGIYYTGAIVSGQFKVIYGILLFSSFLIALFRFRQVKQSLQDKNSYLVTLYEESREDLAQILGYREELLKELRPDEIKIFDRVTADYLKQAIYRVRDYLRLEVSEVVIDKLLSEIKYLLKVRGIQPMPQLVIQYDSKHQTIHADIPRMKQLLINSISYIQNHNPDNKPLIIGIEDTRLGYEISHIPDYLRKIDAIRITITTVKELPKLQEVYRSKEEENGNNSMPMNAELLPLIENARVIDAHYGYLEQDKNNLHMYVLPVDVREVRGKVMELIKEPAATDAAELAHPLAIQLEKELLFKLQGFEIDIQVIHQALDTIKKYHGGIKRRSGEPYFTHPMAVALILLEYSKDQDAVIAALLHDTVEDTSLSLSHIEAMFGERVGFLVGKATNLENKLKRINLADHENLHRLMNYDDEGAALVKLADRLHNMRTITGHPSFAKQKRIAEETLSFFVPMAKHLGLSAIARELEALSLGVLGS